MFQHEKNNKELLSAPDLSTIATDLTNSFSPSAVANFLIQNSDLTVQERDPVRIGDIEKVTVITWEDMYNTRTLRV